MHDECKKCLHGDKCPAANDENGECHGEWYFKSNNKADKGQAVLSNSTGLVIQPCPFADAEKEIGHEPYTMTDGLWHVQCTCGARGPISASVDNAIDNWNVWAL